MRCDHVQARERSRDGVEPDRARVVEPDALPAWLAGADAAGAGVEENREAELLAALVERPVPLVVGSKGLERGGEA